MILYTTMPQELIFHNEEDFTKQSIVTMNGTPMIVEKTVNNEYKIIRLLSTDPTQYLDATLTPGQTISLKPQL